MATAQASPLDATGFFGRCLLTVYLTVIRYVLVFMDEDLAKTDKEIRSDGSAFALGQPRHPPRAIAGQSS